jgi:L-amino acid N-acyltransferase YncA
MHLSHAAPEDAAAIARVHVESWRAAYAGIIPAEYLAALSTEQRTNAWHHSISRGTPELVVARDEGAVVGFAAFGSCRDEGAASTAGEVWAIYVAPSRWSCGVGRELWHHAGRRLVERGFRTVSVWVLAENARAIRFYASAGLTADPASRREITIGGKPLQELRYVTAPVAPGSLPHPACCGGGSSNNYRRS